MALAAVLGHASKFFKLLKLDSMMKGDVRTIYP